MGSPSRPETRPEMDILSILLALIEFVADIARTLKAKTDER